MSEISHNSRFAAPETDSEGRISLIGLSFEEMQEAVVNTGLPKFRAKQLWNWIYERGVKSFDEMQNLPKEMREKLNATCSIARSKELVEQKSADGTIKWLLEMSDGKQVEAVFIPEENRNTLCVSSQVGCTLQCKFCHTGTQALVRNLGAHEVVQQIMFVRDKLGEWPKAGEKTANNEGRDLTNIVVMGMGEPFYNYDNIAKAMKICMDENGMNISKRRITLSTSGVIPYIQKCGDELGVNLAISLHASNNEIRSQIMPINKKYPIEELLDACRKYPPLSDTRRITFEYVMLAGINDSDDCAYELVEILKGIPCKVNLIPFNKWDGAPFECSSGNRMHAFARILKSKGYDAPIRKTRGEDILAACGQLKSSSQREKKPEA